MSSINQTEIYFEWNVDETFQVEKVSLPNIFLDDFMVNHFKIIFQSSKFIISGTLNHHHHNKK